MSWVFCLHVWICNMCEPGVCGSQRKVADPLGPKLLMGKSCHMGVGTELRPSGREASALTAGPSLHKKERLCTPVIFLLSLCRSGTTVQASMLKSSYLSSSRSPSTETPLETARFPLETASEWPSTAVLTGKSLLSFFRGNCGACADPSVFSLISFEIPSPFPKETVVNAEWAHKTEHSLTSTFLFPSFPFLLEESAEACFCQVSPFALGPDSQVARYP